MRKAIVIVTAISALGNQIKEYGDQVTEANFPEGNFDKLIEGGYLKLETSETPEEETPEEESPAKPEEPTGKKVKGKK